MLREGLILLKKITLSWLAILSLISDYIADITDITIYMWYVVELSEFYHPKNMLVNILIQYQVISQKVVLYTHCSQSAILNQIWTSSSSCIRDFSCKKEIKICPPVLEICWYQTNKQTDRQTEKTDAGENIIPHQKGGW